MLVKFYKMKLGFALNAINMRKGITTIGGTECNSQTSKLTAVFSNSFVTMQTSNRYYCLILN